MVSCYQVEVSHLASYLQGEGCPCLWTAELYLSFFPPSRTILEWNQCLRARGPPPNLPGEEGEWQRRALSGVGHVSWLRTDGSSRVARRHPLILSLTWSSLATWIRRRLLLDSDKQTVSLTPTWTVDHPEDEECHLQLPQEMCNPRVFRDKPPERYFHCALGEQGWPGQTIHLFVREQRVPNVRSTISSGEKHLRVRQSKRSAFSDTPRERSNSSVSVLC